MNYYILLFILGGIVCLTGLATFYLTYRYKRTNQVKEFIIGFIFIITGIAIIWLNVRSRNNPNVEVFLPISDKFIGFILPIFVFGLFFVKGVMEIRAGLIENKTASSNGKSYLSNFRIITWVIILVWAIFLIFIFVSGFLRQLP